MEPAVLVGTGGAIGAALRYLVSAALPSEPLPVATLAVNVLGSFALAALVFAGVSGDFALLFGVGLCGSFTTYSSFSVETVRLWETGSRLRALLYAGGTFLACALAAGAAWGLVAVLG
jgi:CrcB protein